VKFGQAFLLRLRFIKVQRINDQKGSQRHTGEEKKSWL
jgi:hypothetical protein